MAVSTVTGVVGPVTESVGNSRRERELQASVWAHYSGSYDILEKPLSAHYSSLFHHHGEQHPIIPMERVSLARFLNLNLDFKHIFANS